MGLSWGLLAWDFDDLDPPGDHRRQESKDFDKAHRMSP